MRILESDLSLPYVEARRLGYKDWGFKVFFVKNVVTAKTHQTLQK